MARILRFKIDSKYVLLVIIAILFTSNVYWVHVNQELSKEKVNALGEVLIQAGGFLDESVHVLNLTLQENRIDFELWEVMLRDLIQLSRYYKLVLSLDIEHAQQWSQIKSATDSLVSFTQDLRGAYAKGRTQFNITDEHSSYLSNVRGHLLNIKKKAFPAKIVIGSNPQIHIVDTQISEAVQNSVDLENDLESAREAFNLPTR